MDVLEVDATPEQADWLRGAKAIGERDTGVQPPKGTRIVARQPLGPLPVLPFDFEAVNDASQRTIANYSDAWWRQFSDSTQKSLRRIIADAERQGFTMPQVIAQVEKLFGPERAMRIAVSEITTLLGMGAQATYQQAGFTRWEWRTVRDALVDIICALRDRQSFPNSVLFERAHVNCLLPGVIVSGAIVEGATARAYDGEAIVVRTASGKELSVTPNHPILTPMGWRSAGLLHEGDEVIEDGRSQEVAPLVSPNDVEMPALVEQVAGALLRVGGVLSVGVPTAAEDFHGDGVPDGDVEVVWADSPLRDRFDATFREPAAQEALVVAGAPLVELAGLRARDEFGGTGYATTRSIMGRSDLLVALGGGHGAPLQEFGGSPPTGLHTCPQEPSADGIAPHAEMISDSLLGHAVEVEPYRLGRIVSVETIRYSGHVYNLQTAAGRYAANGIVVENCRCWPVPYGAPVVPAALAPFLGGPFLGP